MTAMTALPVDALSTTSKEVTGTRVIAVMLHAPRPTDHLEAALTHLDSDDLGAITWYFDRLLASSNHPQVRRLIRALAATTAAELAWRRDLPQDPPGDRGIFGAGR